MGLQYFAMIYSITAILLLIIHFASKRTFLSERIFGYKRLRVLIFYYFIFPAGVVVSI